MNWTKKQYREWTRRAGNSQAAVGTLLDRKKVTTGRTARRLGQKTRVEIDFEARLRLELPKTATILFEGVKLKIDESCWYTPDFWVPELQTFYEVKGPHIWEDSKIKFKAARAIHTWASFEMHQRKNGEWTQLY